MSAAVPTEPLVGRCYTRARRHQNVVGRLPGGGRIWGGPYTVPQIVIAVVALAALALTRGLWAHHGLLDVVPLLGVPYGLALVVGRINIDGRNPFAVAASAAGLLLGASAAGRINGRPLRMPRRGALVGVCTVTWRPEAVVAADAASPISPAGRLVARPAPSAGPAGPRVASGVGALLAARDDRTNEKGQ
ncbi:hypothetical protein [Streptomyces sp. NPDC015125]|uniref:hypothetical protein n=1 Tax=Streptomyces sp. NPDC015125 TaxID=3364938 RepID=UPI0036FD33F2